MKRILAFLLVLCGVLGVMMAPPAEATQTIKYGDSIKDSTLVAALDAATFTLSDGDTATSSTSGQVEIGDNLKITEIKLGASTGPTTISVGKVEGLGFFSDLKKLDMSDLTGSSAGTLTATKVDLSDCVNLETLVIPTGSSTPTAPATTELNLHGLKNLKSVQGLANTGVAGLNIIADTMVSLTSLDLGGCTSLTSVVTNLAPGLKNLNVSGCSGLTQLIVGTAATTPTATANPNTALECVSKV